jgi:hypothetical protein
LRIGRRDVGGRAIARGGRTCCAWGKKKRRGKYWPALPSLPPFLDRYLVGRAG